jgi:hypothetical protein
VIDMAATARPRDLSPTGAVVRLLLAVVLVVPVVLLFLAARRPAVDEQSRADQELLGVDYLRTLQPLTVALLAAQADAVAGRSVNTAAMTQAFAAMDAADGRDGEPLGARDRWQGLRTKIQSLPGPGAPRATYTAYGEAADLLIALYNRVRLTSGLATDPQGDVVGLQRVVAVDLPQINVAIGRYADLVQVGLGGDLSTTALADVLAQRLAAGAPGRDLVDGLQTAVDSTSSSTLGGNVLGEMDAMRRSLDAVSTATGPTGSRPTAADVSAANTLRANAANASAALSAKVLDALTELLTQRRDGAAGDLLRANLAAGGGIAVALALIGLDAAAWTRRRRMPQPAEAAPARREPVGAAR